MNIWKVMAYIGWAAFATAVVYVVTVKLVEAWT